MTTKKQDQTTEIDFSAEAGAGLENVTPKDVGIPFIMVAQKGSDQCNENKVRYISGCKPGDLVDNLTNSIVGTNDNPLIFLPAKYHRLYCEWVPNEKGGGFRGMRSDIPEDATQHGAKLILPNGNELADTAYFLGVVEKEGSLKNCVITMDSTDLKESRQWMSLITSIKLTAKDGSKYTPPIYSHKYKVSTQYKENEKGNWWGFKVENAGRVDSLPMLEEARKINKLKGLLGPASVQNNDGGTTPF